MFGRGLVEGSGYMKLLKYKTDVYVFLNTSGPDMLVGVPLCLDGRCGYCEKTLKM